MNLARVLKLSGITLVLVLSNLLAVEGLLRVANAVYPLEMSARLKDTFQNKWLQGFDWHNGKTRLYNYRNVPGASTNGHEFRVNRWGFRGKDFLPRAEEGEDTFRILVLGDSLTVGQGVGEEQRYSNLLEQKLKTRYPNVKIEVINLGVQGFETLQEYKIFAGMRETVDPDLVIVGFYTNDPNIRYQHYPAFTFPVTGSLRTTLERSLLFRLIDKWYDPIYRWIRGLPTHAQEVDSAYDPGSEDWVIFKKSVGGIAELTAGSTSIPPMVIFLADTTVAKKKGQYQPVREVFDAHGFRWVEIEPGHYRPVSRFDYHAGPSTHRDYAEALFKEIERLDLINTSSAT